MKMDLQTLLETKNFHALNEAEKAFVLHQMEQAEYEKQHELLQQSKLLFAEEYEQLEVNESIRKNALQKLSERKVEKQSGLWFAIVNYKVPAWTAAAAVLLVAVSLLSLPFQNHDIEKKVELIAEVKDTVFLERLIVDTVKIFSDPDTINERIYLSHESKPKATTSAIAIAAKEEKINSALFYTANDDLTANERHLINMDLEQRSYGMSLSQDSIAKLVVGLGMM